MGKKLSIIISRMEWFWYAGRMEAVARSEGGTTETRTTSEQPEIPAQKNSGIKNVSVTLVTKGKKMSRLPLQKQKENNIQPWK